LDYGGPTTIQLIGKEEVAPLPRRRCRYTFGDFTGTWLGSRVGLSIWFWLLKFFELEIDLALPLTTESDRSSR
jgi:hypothetical protein